MRLRVHSIFCVVSFLFLFTLIIPGFTQSQRNGVIRVKVTPGFHHNIQATGLQVSASGALLTQHAQVNELNSRFSVNGFSRVFRESGKFERAHEAFGLHLWYEIHYDSTKADLNEVLDQYRRIADFQEVLPCPVYKRGDYKVTPWNRKITNNLSILSSSPDDPLFGEQWHYKNDGQGGGTVGVDIDLERAWAIESGSEDVIVAVIDGGIDITHPDLQRALWVNEDEIPNNGIDDDNNGYVDDVHGFGFAENSGRIRADIHGTHVGGTIGAVSNNNLGVAGIAGGNGTGNGARLMSLACFSDFAFPNGFEDAMVYAADNGAVISQNSWGGGFRDPVLEAAINYFNARAGLDNSDANFDLNIQIGPMAGGLVVFAAGNANSQNENMGYPGSLSQVIAVSATNRNDHKANFSNYGSWIELSAPGEEVFSTFPMISTIPEYQEYGILSGTSMACPHVSGVAALIVSRFSTQGFTREQAAQRLINSTEGIDQLNPEYSGALGTGRLNAFRALQPDLGAPPDVIGDLLVIEPYINGAELQWTAPGASGSVGVAAFYDIRYSTDNITNENFDVALPLAAFIKPSEAGSLEKTVVSGLEPGIEYFVAIRTTNVFGLTSSISNVVSVQTLPPPVVSVSPQSFEIDLVLGDETPVMREITITNEGLTNLEVFVTAQRNERLQLVADVSADHEEEQEVRREERRQFKRPVRSSAANQRQESTLISPANLPFEVNGVRLFACLIEDFFGKIYEVNPLNAKLKNGFFEAFQSSFSGLAYDNQHVYFGDGGFFGRILKFDIVTGEQLDEFKRNEFHEIFGLAHDGEFLYGVGYSDRLFKIDFNGKKLLSTRTLTFTAGEALTHGGNRGTLYLTDTNGHVIYEINPSTGDILNTLDLGETRYIPSLAYSSAGNVLFAYDYNSFNLLVLDPDTGAILHEVYTGIDYWGMAADESYQPVTSDHSTKTILPGESITVPVEFSARGLLGNTYHYEIMVNSNDPVTPQVVVPATLNVIGPPPQFVKDRTQLLFGPIYVSQNRTLRINISNQGASSVLQIRNISTTDAQYEVDKTEFNLYPQTDGFIDVTFAPFASGTFNSKLLLETNDPNFPLVEIPLLGGGVMPPVIQTDKNGIAVQLALGETRNVSLTIFNTGTAALNWQLKLDTEPSEDIAPLLRRLDSGGGQRIADLVPSRYDFTGGQSGRSIRQTQEPDMYGPLGGNQLVAFNQVNRIRLDYTNSTIQNENLREGSFSSATGNFFTTKHPGLFTFVASSDVRRFEIDGELSGNHSILENNIISATALNGEVFKGYLSRAYGPDAPSVNHLFIIHDVGDVTHSPTNSRFLDFHRLSRPFDSNRIPRIYYLMFSSQRGARVEDAVFEEIMSEFLNTIAYPQWGKIVTARSGQLQASEETTAEIQFSTEGLKPGVYHALLEVYSNDPNRPKIDIPIELTVTDGIENQSPEIIEDISNKEILVGEDIVISLSQHFSDPEGGALTFSVDITGESLVDMALEEGQLALTGLAPGVASITATATDPLGASNTAAFTVTVAEPPTSANQPPLVTTQIADLELFVGDEFEIILTNHFADADQDPLSFEAAASSSDIANMSVNANNLKLVAKKSGSVNISVTAKDPSQAVATIAFSLEVHDPVLGLDESVSRNFSFSPNPFRESLDFTMKLASASMVRLRLTDSFGRMVAIPLDANYPTGEFSQSIQLSGCASGVYYYTLSINGKTYRGKLIKY